MNIELTMDELWLVIKSLKISVRKNLKGIEHYCKKNPDKSEVVRERLERNRLLVIRLEEIYENNTTV